MATGSVVDRVDPKPITILQDPVYLTQGSIANFSDLFTSVSNGAITVTSANTNIVTVNYNNTIYAQAVGETTLNIHQQAGTSGEGSSLKQWPVSDETISVIVLGYNEMKIGVVDQYSNFSEKTTLDLVAGQDVNLYFYTLAGSNGGVFSCESSSTAVTVGSISNSSVMYTSGFCPIHAASVGSSTVTITQDRNTTYGSVTKSITINVTTATTNLSLAQSAVSVGSNSGTAEVAIITNNTESTPVVTTTTGADYFDAIYQNGKVVVTGKAVGSGTVTVSQAASASFSAATDVVLDVTVTAPQHALTVTPTTMTFDNTNEAQNITASSSTGATITYESSNTSVATVSDAGVVTPKGNGTATITVTAAASDDYLASTKTVSVSVTNYPVNYGTDISEYIGGTLPASAFGDATTAVITIIGGSYTQTYWYTSDYAWTWTNNYGSIAAGTAYEKELDADAVSKIKAAGGLILEDWGNHPAALYLKLNP